MRKRVFVVLLIAVLCLPLSSCGDSADFSGGELQGDLEFVSVPDCEESVILYHENKYYPTGSWFKVMESEDATEIGMGYIFPFPDTYFLVHDMEDPLYIFASDVDRSYASEVYIKEGYDWQNQVFAVADTEEEVVFSDMITKVESDVEPENYLAGATLILHLKDEPRLVLQENLYEADEDWYFIKDGERWFLTDEFVAILKEISILPD